PCIIRETTPRGMLEMALVENVQRVDLNALDRAKGFERLMNEFGLTTSEIAVRIGKSVSYVSNSIRLLSLPDALKDGLLSGLISEGHARALAAIDDQNLMVEAYKIILRESGSVRRAEELARRMKSKAGQSNDRPGIRKNQLRVVSEEIDKMEESFQKSFVNGEKEELDTKVKLIRSRRETKLTFIFRGDLEETEDKLQRVYKAIVK
ncbi:MAG: ParB/RepB/Spo0J family partition protein, partial [Actinomycetota bacterium]